MFEVHDKLVGNLADGIAYVDTFFPDFYRLGTVNVTYSGTGTYTADQIQLNELNKYQNSPLAVPRKSNPMYSKFSTGASSITIKIYPATELSSTRVDYVRKPKAPNWTYLIGGSKNALYNPSAVGHQDFELHSSEETNLVIKILQLAGIAIKDFNLLQAAAQEETKSIQLEKQ